MRTAAIAAGGGAADDLERAWSSDLGDGHAALVHHRSSAVAWSTRSRWVETHDDDDLLVVLDGRLHGMAVGSMARDVAARYRSSGVDLAVGLSGDFVAIVLERSTGTLLVARDPVGVRPWYQATRGGRQAGASEVATLVSLPWVDREVDQQTAIEHLAAMTTGEGRTFHRGIATLAPGSTWVANDHGVHSHRHHRWSWAPDLETTWEEAADRCRLELDQAVGRRLAWSDPVTSELSGGLDSSAVVGTTVGLEGRDLLVGRLVFEGSGADERPWSDAVIDHWQLPAVSSAPWIPDAETAASLTAQLARPLPDPHFLMFAELRRTLLRAGRTDVLTGLGGDDAFVSASPGSVAVSAAQLRQWPVLGHLARLTLHHPLDSWRRVHKPALHHLAPWRGDRVPRWVSAAAIEQAELPRRFRERPPRATGIAAIDERIANISRGYDAAVLEAQAVVSDLVGVRATHPFLDSRLIEATYGLDPSWPGRGDHSRALQVEAYRDRMPRVVAERRSKVDFAEVFWPQVLADDALARVRTGPLRDRGWIDPAGVDDLVHRARTGMANAAIPLARCVSLDRWLRTR